MPDISFKVDLLSDATRDNIGFKNAAGVQQYVPKFVTDSSGNTVGIADPVGGRDAGFVIAKSDPLTGGVSFSVNGLAVVNRLAIGGGLVLPFMQYPTGGGDTLNIPNPYAGQANAPAHPALLFFPTGWNGYRYWLAFTPYPGYDSTYENPSVVASNDFEQWVAPTTNPLVAKPSGAAYNADPHIFMSSDNSTMYLAYRERGVASMNNVKVMETTDGRNWSTPIAILSGTVGVQDFGSPSIWWNGTGWTCISHNLDGASPWPVQRRVSNTPNIYGAWGTPTTVSIPPISARAWWHSFFLRTPSGQVLGLVQDNAGAVGSPGILYFANSGDDGVTFGGVRQVFRTGSKYRSCFCLETHDGVPQMRMVVSDFSALTLTAFVLTPSQAIPSIIDRIQMLIANAKYPLGNTRWVDTFTRSDSASFVGVADSGGSYIVSAGTWGISNNAAYPVANGRLLAAVGVDTYRAGVQFVDMTVGVQQWFIFRAIDSTNYWRIGVVSPYASGDQTLSLQSIIAGNVVFNTNIGLIARGQCLSVETTASGFRVYVENVFQYERIDGTHGTATQIGLQSNAGANSKYRHLTCESL